MIALKVVCASRSHGNTGRVWSDAQRQAIMQWRAAQPAETTEQFAHRFWARVDRSGDCWLWQGALNRPGGYGRVGRHGRHVLAHRVALELTFGAIPDGLQVLHRCDVPRCCNPSHLWLGSRSDNMRDAVVKGRLSPVIPWATRWGWFIVRCAWCSRVTGAKPPGVSLTPEGAATTGRASPIVSHGCCPTCYARLMAELTGGPTT